MKLRHVLAAPTVMIAASLYAAASVVFTQVPLLNYLGYEFSALSALLGSFIAGFVAIGLMRGDIPEGEPGSRGRRAAGLLRDAAIANVALLLIPLLVISVNALFVRNCSFTEGIAFFLLLPVVSVLFASALGFFCVAHYAHPRLIFLLFCGAIIGYSLLLGYFTPAIFSYNFLYGFFPGVTYDELLPLNTTLVLFRLITLFAAAIVAWLGLIVASDVGPGYSTRLKGQHLAMALVAPGRRILTAAIALILTTIYVYRCELGIESTAGFIKQTLGGEYSTEHFIIYYARNSLTDDEIRRTGAEHEFRLNQVLDALALPRTRILESYVYPSPEVKQRLIGAGNTDIAKPWSGQIHLSRQSLAGSLKHEIVHAAAAPFGLPVIRASMSTGLVEGLAVAVDGEWGNRTLHEYAAAMRTFGVATDIREIMNFWGFAAHPSSVSYVLAGSFCKYLIDRYGIRKMMQLYRSVDYRTVYGRSLNQLMQEWQGYLDRVSLDEIDEDGVDAMFRRPSIFSKVCARVLARRNLEAHAAFGRKDYAVAESLFSRSYVEGRGFDALAGKLASALRQRKFDVLRSAMDSIILADERPARYLSLFVGIGDAYWATGDPEKAFALYDRVYHADLSEAQTEAAAVRILAMNADSSGARYLRLFLSDGGDFARVTIVDSLLTFNRDDQVLRYLKGRALMRLGDYPGAAGPLESVRFMDDDGDLEGLRLRYLGETLFCLGRYGKSRDVFWTSLNAVATEVAEERVNAWIDRCEWMQSHGL